MISVTNMLEFSVPLQLGRGNPRVEFQDSTRFQIGPTPYGDTANLQGKRNKCGGGEEEEAEEEELFPTDDKENQARAWEEESQPLPEGYRSSAISANFGVAPFGFARSRLGPGAPVIRSDIAMTFELSVNARLFGPT
ncbi:hypothetical protein B0H14DRAFT_3124164, partial [Mycena olivaceomarginata]